MKERVPIRENLFRKDENGIVLLGSKCTKCGKICFPKHEFCTACLSKEVEEVELDKKGTLFTWSILRVGDNHYQAPHPIGIIDFPNQRVRVTAPLVMREEGYEIGMPMEVVPSDLWEEEDKIVEGYRYKVIEEDDK